MYGRTCVFNCKTEHATVGQLGLLLPVVQFFDAWIKDIVVTVVIVVMGFDLNHGEL